MPKKSLVVLHRCCFKRGTDRHDVQLFHSLEWVELSRQVSRYEVTEIVHLTVALKSVKEVAKKKQLWCFNDRRQKEIRDGKELCPIG